jgi:hypothetical protein
MKWERSLSIYPNPPKNTPAIATGLDGDDLGGEDVKIFAMQIVGPNSARDELNNYDCF